MDTPSLFSMDLLCMANIKRTRPSRRSSSVFQFDQLEPRQLLAADITTTWMDFETQPLLGETVLASIDVSNSGDETGYGAYVNVLIPGGTTSGNGLTYVVGSGTLLDSQLRETTIQFDSNGLAQHPFELDGWGESYGIRRKRV